ncbi:sacsin-like [Eucyclogobius newberryi]|uniref:sacsin-like n=1 Tax=Eucyclogobius newberryi TaxID=166745 RepID=UPI003B5A76B0
MTQSSVKMDKCPDEPWLPWVTVAHEYLGPKSFRVSSCTSVGEVKQLVYEETYLPVLEQRLTHNGKVLEDNIQIGALLSSTCTKVSLKLESRGLRGGGKLKI